MTLRRALFWSHFGMALLIGLIVFIMSISGALLAFEPQFSGLLNGNSTAVEKFFDQIQALHRWIAVQGDLRRSGRAVTGAANLGLLFMILSGVYLWIPRTWTFAVLRAKVFLRAGLTSSRPKQTNRHHVFAFWFVVPIIVIVGSGVALSYGWASNLLVAGVQGLGLEAGSNTLKTLKLVHSGLAFGVIGQLIAFLTCLAICVLIYSGWSLAFRRIRGS